MKAGKDFIGVSCGAIIINNNNEVLLVKRSKNSRTEPSMWSRPGGQVEFNELTPKAVEREIKEETNLIVEVVRPLEFTENFSNDKATRWIALGFLANHISNEPKNLEPHKHDTVQWFPLDSLPDNLTNYTKNSIDVYLNTKYN